MIADRMAGVDLSGIRKMFERAGKDAINFGIGEPDFQPPDFVIEAYYEAMKRGDNKYGPSAGIPELRHALAAKHGVADTSVIVTCGSTIGLYSTMASFVNPGEEVLCPDPGFVLYAPHVRLVNGKPIFYPVREEKKFVPQVEDLEPLITRKTKAVIFNSPSNPTGGTIPKRDVAELAAWADRHSLVIVSDEAYDTITYDEPHASFLGTSPNVVYLNTFSKTYAMTGWRIGYAIASPAFADALKKMNYHLVACPPTPTQHACLAALEGPQDRVREMVQAFRERRDLMVKMLKDIPGFDLATPRGAFYAFPAFKQHITAENFANRILEAGVVTIPGDAFGARGAHHLRLSYATSPEKIEKGLAIVKRVAETIK